MFAFSVSNCWLRIQGQLDKEHSCCPSNCMEKGYWMTCSWRESTHDTGQWPVFHLQNIIHFKWLFFVGFNRCCWVVFPHSLCSPLFPVFSTYYLYCGLMGCDTMHSYSSYSVSEENVASIFNTEHSSEILVPTYKTTGCNKTEDCLYSLLSHAMMGWFYMKLQNLAHVK